MYCRHNSILGIEDSMHVHLLSTNFDDIKNLLNLNCSTCVHDCVFVMRITSFENSVYKFSLQLHSACVRVHRINGMDTIDTYKFRVKYIYM